jgi:chemotaxis protein methyltransferase CheR
VSHDAARMDAVTLSDAEFAQFQRFIRDAAGVALTPAKKCMLASRLGKRLAACGVTSYGEYFRLLAQPEGAAEVQRAIDLLTTHETYFFREQKHFDALRTMALREHLHSRPFRVWSAACSSGEEPYSIAMVLADCLGPVPWEVLASDISTPVLQRAMRGHYPLERTRHIPAAYLRAHCLRGVGPQAGTLLVDRALRQRVTFSAINLDAPLPAVGTFDVIFLRNVMIYFDLPTKRGVVGRLLSTLRAGGHFYVGHSESLTGLAADVQALAPSIYRKD